MYLRSLFFLLLLFTLVACKPPQDKTQSNIVGENSTIKARVELAQDAKLGNVPVLVYVLENNQGVSGAEVEVTGDMTHAGMVPVIAKAIEVEAGLYQAQDFEFTMAGDWILTTIIKTPAGEKLTVETKLTVPGN